MTHANLIDRPILNLIPSHCGVTLDVACGYGFWGFLIKIEKNCDFLVGVDIWKPYLKKLQKLNIYDGLIVTKLPYLPFRKKTFDITLACEILEHLEKRDGLNLLTHLEEITKKRIIISTPLRYPQDAIRNNPYEAHTTEWSLLELKQLGYQVQRITTLDRILALVDKFKSVIRNFGKSTIYLIAKKELE